MSKFTVHECPLSDIPLAAHTLVNVMTRTNPLIAYIHNSNLPLSPIPYGKLQLITIYLFQLSTTGIILSIDDEETNEKCVGVAVWSGPLKRSIWQRIWISLKMFYLRVWMTVNLLWFGNVQNVKVHSLTITNWTCVEKRCFQQYSCCPPKRNPRFKLRNMASPLCRCKTSLPRSRTRK